VLAGGLPALLLLLLLHFESKKCEVWLPYLAAAAMPAFCMLLQAVLYNNSMPRLS